MDAASKVYSRIAKLDVRLHDLKMYLETVKVALLPNPNSDEQMQTLDSILNYPIEEIASHSIVILACTAFEREVKSLSKLIKDEMRLGIKISQIKGNLCERLKLYLSSVTRIDLEWEELGFEAVEAVYKIRNCIVHDSGELCEYNGKGDVENAIKKVDGARIYKEKIYFSEESSEFVIDKIYSFLKKLYEKVGEELTKRNSNKSVFTTP